jgi:glyoxylase-like metal-dependent hydrolase (beta-lactamase superfamily II)
MNKVASLALAAGFTVLALTPFTSAAEEQPSVSVTPLKGPLHLMQGRGGNVVVSIGDDGVLLVDDDYAPYAGAYQQAIAKLTESDIEPRFVLNTHWHGDHTGSNTYWGERGAVIMAHTNVRQRMSTRQEMKALDRVVEPSPKVALPVVTYGDSLAVHFNGDDIEVQYYPRGHTDGDSVVFYSRENVVHMGDLFFKDAFPFVDIGSGGDVFGYTANVEALLARVDDSTLIVPGHGSLANKADLKRFHQMLITTSTKVKSGLEQGMTVEAITEQGLGPEWASWGKGFINEAKWISIIAGSLQANR